MDRRITRIAIEITAIMLAVAAMWYAFKISSFSSLSESDAKWWLHVSELSLIFFALLLFIGLIGEWPDSESWKKRLLYKAAKCAVIIGVFGELLGDAGIFETTGRLQIIQDGEIAAAKLELEKIKSPRVIKNISAVVYKVRAYPNMKYWVITETADQDPISEAMKLSQQIRRVFDEAKWVQESHLNRYSKEPMPLFSAVSDPGCLVSTAGDEKSLRVMKAVIEAFKPDFECDEYVDFNIISGSVLIHVGFHGGR
jgi:hypothetical protein